MMEHCVLMKVVTLRLNEKGLEILAYLPIRNVGTRGVLYKKEFFSLKMAPHPRGGTVAS